MTRSRIVLLTASIAVALLIGACQAGVASPSASTAAEAADTPAAVASGEGELRSDLDLEVGDCFNLSSQPSQVEVVACNEPHVYEAFAVFDHEADAAATYPGEDPVFEFADAECRARFSAYVGLDYETSSLFYTSVSPSATTWAGGDRESVCALHTQDKTPVTGSARGLAE